MAIEEKSSPGQADVFISYSSSDRERVLDISSRLVAAGMSVWIDRNKIEGGRNYGSEIVQGIKNCKVLILMCSDAAMRSRNVKQEIQLAWKYERPYLPLLLEPTSFPEQIEYWLEGHQWIEVMANRPEEWLPQVLQALTSAGLRCSGKEDAAGQQGIQAGLGASEEPRVDAPAPPVLQLERGLEGLRSIAKFTDQIWPVPTNRVGRGGSQSASRGLGAPQEDVQHGHRLGSRLSLSIESDRAGYLMLLDEGPENIVYCLCPSWFAPDTRLREGRCYLPQAGSRYDSFVVSGEPGREHLLAVITDEPLGLDWLPPEPKTPARVLSQADINDLLGKLRNQEADRWTALSTYFDVIA